MAKETVYELFDKFLEKLKGGKSMFSDNEVFSKENVSSLIENYIKKPDVSKMEFDEKIKKQLTSESQKELMANAIWLWSCFVGDINYITKLNSVSLLLDEKLDTNNDEGYTEEFMSCFSKKTILHAGQYHKTNKYHEIKFIINLFNCLQREPLVNIMSIKKNIISFIKEDREKQGDIEYKWSVKSIATHNILLHLCAPDEFEPIANYNHKKEIVEVFKELLDSDSSKDNDKNIQTIKAKLKDEYDVELSDGFYTQEIRQFWNFQGIDTKEDFSELKALKFKKSIVFYGPPGTSKTYNAKKLAEILIRQAFIKENVKKALDTGFEDEYENRISNLQLHANYSYEDFIIGMRIEKDNTVWEKGWLLKKIEEINKENENTGKKLPYVIILDEINRVDLSRLFGELFSAIENRDTDVELSALDKDGKRITVNIPSNLYFIGTMNEIDFSLERIDFALRRRFVWYFYGYNEDTLKSIIKSKSAGFKDGHLEEFIIRATALNKSLKDDEDFGKQWQIGHTFFAEIVEIVISTQSKMKNILLFTSSDNKLKSAKNPVKILWGISIKPMLEAYCGNLDKESKKEKLDGFEDRFLKGVNGK
jgi:5-methylcytosine-specific restriction protein B